ncbi:PREDICTED: uncharacterized protein LOC105586298 [Cercocebus atys]|uniref:uncharacterized protein LOC105586298 n=1 Tax=Cercocebus atys TaxID=9531 RepID=UPI0005F53060|nr:PREDICTED: uncharacterized protein LOC105586298 [Cercocebus atys]
MSLPEKRNLNLLLHREAEPPSCAAPRSPFWATHGGGGLRRGPEGELGEGRKRKSSARVVEKKSPAVESHSRSRSPLVPSPRKRGLCLQGLGVLRNWTTRLGRALDQFVRHSRGRGRDTTERSGGKSKCGQRSVGGPRLPRASTAFLGGGRSAKLLRI